LETGFPDCYLVEAASMTKAISIAQARSPEVIIMDIGLSEMGYFEALERIKTVAPATQIVVLTNYEEEEVQCTLATANEVSIYFLWKDNMLTELGPILASLLLLEPVTTF
jgi:CheY-like chemotaxis protein